MFGIITFRDECTINTLRADFEALRQGLQQWDDIVVDTAEVTKIDIASLQMLLAAKKECLRKGREFVIRKSETVTQLLRATGIQL